MDKSHKALIRNIGSEPLAPKLQESVEDPCDRAIANAQRIVQIIEQLRARFDTEEISTVTTIDDECNVFLQDGSFYRVYMTGDGGLYLSRRRQPTTIIPRKKEACPWTKTSGTPCKGRG